MKRPRDFVRDLFWWRHEAQRVTPSKAPPSTNGTPLVPRSDSASAATYAKGDFIGTKYEVHAVLGVGGFGVVYLVYSHWTKLVYALKTLRDEHLNNEQTRERFRKEAKVWVDLDRRPYIAGASFVEEVAGRLY